ncbi:hypothetical protein V8F20_001769 [Naviculisporaceae sp. PSN 640]
MAFQDDPGIAFRETTVEGKHEDRDWFYNPQLRRTAPPYSSSRRFEDPRVYPRRSKKWHKTRSLKEMALEVVVKNIHTATQETLANIPLPYLWLIFEECALNDMVSFHSWKMFSKLLPGDQDREPDRCLRITDTLHSCHVRIESPSYDLSYYTRHLASPGTPIDFLTFLHIKPCVFRTDELLTLARLNNLLFLSIVDTGYKQEAAAVTNHLIRGWSETEMCFPSLKFLTLESTEVSVRSLRYILKFPSLGGYRCRPSSHMSGGFGKLGGCIAREHGWIMCDQSGDIQGMPDGDWRLSVPAAPKIPVAQISLGELYDGSTGPYIQFARVASSASKSLRAPSPPVEPSPPRPDNPTPRRNIQARKKRRFQDVLSSFDA